MASETRILAAQYFTAPPAVRWDVYAAWCHACALERAGYCGACEPCLAYIPGPPEHICQPGPSSPA